MGLEENKVLYASDLSKQGKTCIYLVLPCENRLIVKPLLNSLKIAASAISNINEYQFPRKT